MKHTFLAFVLFCNLVSSFAIDISTQPTRKLWVLDGFAQAIKEADGTVYIGGPFKRVGRWTGSAAFVNATTGEVTPGFPQVNGVIGGAAEDGAGGFFIIGSFTEIGGIARSNIAHVNANGALDLGWTAGATNSIRGISIRNGRIYYFSSSETENNATVTKIGALQLSDGSPLNFSITVKGTINQILATDNRLYVAGKFTQQTTSQAWHLAAYDLNGQLTSWNPGLNDEASVMAISGDIIYFSGYFSVAGGKLRNGLAAASVTTGQVLDWSPGAGVSAMTVADNVLYLGGGFTQMQSQNRTNFAAFNATTGELLPFQAEDSATSVRSIAVGPDYIALGGDIGFNVKDPKLLRVLDRATGAVRPTLAKPNLTVLAVIASADRFFIGGAFSMLNGEERIGAAAFDAATGDLTPWNPRAETNVLALAIAGDKVIIAGELNSIGGQPRKHIGAVDRVTGALIENWQADADFGIIDMAVYLDRLYVGGIFRNIGGEGRTNIAALDLQSGAVLPFNPLLNRAMVRAVTVSGDILYIGGLFRTVGTETRNRLAAFDLTTEALTSWDPKAASSGSNVEDIHVNGDTIYIVGRFTTMGGQPRTNAAAVSLTGELLPWAPNPTGNTVSVRAYGDKVFLAGEFQNVGGQPRSVLAATDLAGNVLPWAPNPEFLGYALTVANDQLYFGGAFVTLSKEVRFGFAGFSLTTIPVEPPNLDPASIKFDLASGTVDLNIYSDQSIVITPQFSQNLKDWTDLPTITINGAGTIRDENAGSRPATFYRLKFGP